MEYTNREMCDMHYFYGLANGSNTEALRLYAESFPNRRIPDRRFFQTIHQRLCEIGRLAPLPREVGSLPLREDLEEAVLRAAEEQPELSTRRLAHLFNISKSAVWRILHRAGYYPYHLQRVQALYAGDRERRLNFCRWFSAQPQRTAYNNFAWIVLFTDEAIFTRDGINNFHNQHLWAVEHPHAVIESRNQQQFSLNVWAGIVADCLIGPVFLPARLNGEVYHRFLAHQLRLLLEEVPVGVRQRMWFMHDGAPAHFSRLARDWLSNPNNFGNHWIGRGGPVAWPPRSPDLNPLDFFFWGHCKSLVYSQPINNVEVLRQRIVDAFNTIRNMEYVFSRVNRSIYRRLEACITTNGDHFEQLL